MFADLQYALRSLSRRPAHAALVVFTLALGLGVNTVAFSSVNALVFRPFAVAGSDTYGWVFVGTTADPHASVSRTTFDAVRAASTLDVAAAEGRLPLTAVSAAGPEQIWALAVSSDYFTIVPAPTVAGRVLSSRDVPSGAVPILMSERYWRARWGAADLTTITPVLNGQLASVIGIVADDFQGPGGLFEPHVWFTFDALPALRLDPAADGNAEWLTMVARPKAEATRAQIDAEMLALARGLAETGERDRVRAQYIPIREGHPEARQLGSAALLGLAAVGLVLLIACFNVAGLILARSVERQRELGIRAALGAGRHRLTRLLLAEGLVLATLAGTAALLVAAWSESLLGGLSLPAPIPQRLHFSVDWRMIAFTAALVLVAAAVPTLTPAWRIARVDPIRWLKGSGSGPASGALAPATARRLFVRLQVVGATTFMTLALLFVASFVALDRRDPGFNLTQTATMQISPSRTLASPERQAELVRELTDRLASRPDIAAVGIAERVPFQLGVGRSMTASADGRDCAAGGCVTAAAVAVSPAYFDAMGITLRAGRAFAAPLGRDTDVVMVNDAAARALWPGALAVGQWLYDDQRRPRQVIGIAADVSVSQLQETARPMVYVPLQPSGLGDALTLVVRAHTDGVAGARAMREAWRELGDTLPPAAVQTMQERMALPLWPARVAAAFFATCGAVAVILVTVGLFGVTWQLVSQRTREFGVRLALGATPADLRRLIIGESLRLAGPALVVGLLVAFAAASTARALLPGVSPFDPRLYAAALVLQLAVTLLASWSPALRATRVSPRDTMSES